MNPEFQLPLSLYLNKYNFKKLYYKDVIYNAETHQKLILIILITQFIKVADYGVVSFSNYHEIIISV